MYYSRAYYIRYSTKFLNKTHLHHHHLIAFPSLTAYLQTFN